MYLYFKVYFSVWLTYDIHITAILQYMCLNMLCIECAGFVFTNVYLWYMFLLVGLQSLSHAALPCVITCFFRFDLKSFFKKARKNGWKVVAGIEWTIHCMKIRMAPAQGWHAQIEKCRYQVLLFIAWREWKDKGGAIHMSRSCSLLDSRWPKELKPAIPLAHRLRRKEAKRLIQPCHCCCRGLENNWTLMDV